MKRMKRFLIALLALVLVLPMAAVQAQSAAVDPDCFTYEIIEGQVHIAGFSGPVSGTVEIPSTIEGYPVYAIGDCAFEGSHDMTELIIPDSVTVIGESAFADCSALKRVIIPDSVTRIDAGAFSNCTGMNVVFYKGTSQQKAAMTIDDSSLEEKPWHYGVSEKTWEGQACVWCADCETYYNYDGSLVEATVEFVNPDGTVLTSDLYYYGQSVTAPEDPAQESDAQYSYVFTGWDKTVTACTGTTTYTARYRAIPLGYVDLGTVGTLEWNLTTNGTLTITGTGEVSDSAGENAWLPYGSQIKKLVIGDGITAIGDRAFDCGSFEAYSNLTSVTLGNGVETIGYEAFQGCPLKELHLGSSVRSVGFLAFADTDLRYIIFPDSMETVDMYVCLNSYVTAVMLPAGIQTIQSEAFNLTENLGTVFYKGTQVQKDKVTIEDMNDPLVDATWHYSVTQRQWADQDCIWCPECKTYFNYNGSLAKATVTFVNHDGKVLSTQQCAYNTVPAKPADPVRNMDAQYIYTFAGWDKDLTACTGATTYTATYTAAAHGYTAVGTCGDDLTWTLDKEGTLTVSGTGEMGYYWVEEEDGWLTFDPPWRDYCDQIKRIVVEEGVTVLSESAFMELENVTHVYLPASVIRIEAEAFGFTQLGRIFYAGTEAQANAVGLTDGLDVYQWHYGVVEETRDGQKGHTCAKCGKWFAFTGDHGGYFITFQNSDGTVLSEKYYCIGDTVTPPADPQKAPDAQYMYTFTGWDREIVPCAGDATYTASYSAAPNTLLDYGTCGTNILWTLDENGVLKLFGTGEMKNYTYAASEGTVAPWADRLAAVHELVIGEGITYVGEYAFYDCANLVSVTVASTVTSFGGSAFDGCTSLTQLHITDLKAWVSTEFLTPGYTYSYHSNPLKANQNQKDLYVNGELVTELVIPEGVRTIGDYAFTNTSITDVVFPDSVTTVGSQAFNNCDSLTHVKLGSGVKTLSGGAFSACAKLAYAELPQGLTSIGSGVFSTCTKLKFIHIPASVTTVGQNAFQNCSGLESVILESGLTQISYYMFNNCSCLKDVYYVGTEKQYSMSVIVGSGNTNYTDATFHFVPAAGSIGGLFWVYDETGTLTILGSGAMPDFETAAPWAPYAADIKALVLPSELTAIGSNAFAGLSGITQLSVPLTLKSVGENAFQGCTALTAVSYPGTVQQKAQIVIAEGNAPLTDAAWQCIVASGTCASGVTWTLDSFGVLTITGNTYIPDVATKPSWNAHRNAIKHVVIEEGITRVGSKTFKDMPAIESVTIPKTVTSIRMMAFYNCDGLKQVNLPEGLTTIENVAFGSCDSLETVHIPASVTTIGNGAFHLCQSLRSITVAQGSASFCTDEAGVLYSLDKTKLVQAPATLSGSYVIPEGVTRIEGFAFSACGITQVTLPESLVYLGAYAFQFCNGLTQVTIPAAVVNIESAPFRGCSALKTIAVAQDNTAYTAVNGVLYNKALSIMIQVPGAFTGRLVTPNTLEQIKIISAYNTKGLTELVLPAALRRVEIEAFSGCTGLNTVYYTGTAEQREAIDVGTVNQPLLDASWKHISAMGTCGEGVSWMLDRDGVMTLFGDGAVIFADAAPWDSYRQQIQTLVVQPGISLVDGFADCDGLTEVSLPDTLLCIAFGAFRDCDRLTQITVPASVSTIGGEAFALCDSLTAINVAEGNAAYSADSVGVLFDRDKTVLHQAPGGLRGTYTVPEGTKTLGIRAFWGCTKVEQLNLPASLETLDIEALHNMPALKHIRVAEENPFLTADDWGVLYNKNMTELVQAPAGLAGHYTVPDAVTEIYEYKFYGCTQLRCVTLPAGLTYVGCGAFSGCTGLEHVLFKGTLAQWNAMFRDGGNDALTDALRHYEANGDEAVVENGTLKCWLCDPTIGRWVERNGKLTYVYGDGTMAQDAWKLIDGKWYAFDRNGFLRTNVWHKDSVGWCYLGADGTMTYSKWIADSIGWCYVGADGYMVTDRWVRDSVSWCYVGSHGYILTDAWVQKDGRWCYVDENGRQAKNMWVRDSVGWCYLDASGYIAAGQWKQDANGKWCYLDENGRMKTNAWAKDAKGWCYLDGSGCMKTNAWVRDSVGWCYVGADGYCVTDRWMRDSKGWVYLNGEGRMTTDAWVKDSQGWCYVGSDGYAITNSWKKDSQGWCYLDANGRMAISSWISSGNKWYYTDSNGYRVTGWKRINGNWYWFNEGGVMATNTEKDGGHFDGNGIWHK